LSRHRKIQFSRSKAMVIAAAGALSVATAASATVVTWGQGGQGTRTHADGTAEITHETVTPETVTPETVTPETVTQETVTQETVTRHAVTPEAMALEAMTPGAAVAPRLTATDQLAGPIAETAAEQSGDTSVQDAYLARLAAVREAIAQRKAASKAAAAKAAAQAARGQAAGNSAAQSPAGTTSASGSAQQLAQAMLASFGWSSSQFSCLDPLWAHESGWSVTAANAGSGAYGIPQALPGSRMASAGPDWQTNAATQIKWGLKYIKGTYGSPCGAWSHEETTGWY
jgi:hypothetical protein